MVFFPVGLQPTTNYSPPNNLLVLSLRLLVSDRQPTQTNVRHYFKQHHFRLCWSLLVTTTDDARPTRSKATSFQLVTPRLNCSSGHWNTVHRNLPLRRRPPFGDFFFGHREVFVAAAVVLRPLQLLNTGKVFILSLSSRLDPLTGVMIFIGS